MKSFFSDFKNNYAVGKPRQSAQNTCKQVMSVAIDITYAWVCMDTNALSLSPHFRKEIRRNVDTHHHAMLEIARTTTQKTNMFVCARLD